MSSPEVVASVEQMRDAARAYAADVGLRRAAEEIGLSFSGLRTLLAGTSPYPATVAKLRAWYLSRSPVAPEEARAFLGRLLDHLPPERRDAVLRELVARVEEESRAAGVEVPAWVGVVRG